MYRAHVASESFKLKPPWRMPRAQDLSLIIAAHQVVSRLQILSAIFKATTTAVDGTLKTPNVHSEIVASLTSSNNVSI